MTTPNLSRNREARRLGVTNAAVSVYVRRTGKARTQFVAEHARFQLGPFEHLGVTVGREEQSHLGVAFGKSEGHVLGRGPAAPPGLASRLFYCLTSVAFASTVFGFSPTVTAIFFGRATSVLGTTTSRMPLS